MSAPIIEARGVSAGYGASQVLRGIDFAVHAGETIGLMGRNGMGKTTLIRTLLGLLPAQCGSVLLDGADAAALPAFRRARRGIAVVPENRGVFASLSVMENLRLAARPGVGRGPRAGAVPAAARTPPESRQPAVRRRAADAGDRPRADDQSAVAGAG